MREASRKSPFILRASAQPWNARARSLARSRPAVPQRNQKERGSRSFSLSFSQKRKIKRDCCCPFSAHVYTYAPWNHASGMHGPCERRRDAHAPTRRRRRRRPIGGAWPWRRNSTSFWLTRGANVRLSFAVAAAALPRLLILFQKDPSRTRFVRAYSRRIYIYI